VLDAQIDRGEETVVHQDDIAPMGVGNGNAASRIEKRDIAVDGEALPSGRGKELGDILVEIGRTALKARNCFTAAS